MISYPSNLKVKECRLAWKKKRDSSTTKSDQKVHQLYKSCEWWFWSHEQRFSNLTLRVPKVVFLVWSLTRNSDYHIKRSIALTEIINVYTCIDKKRAHKTNGFATIFSNHSFVIRVISQCVGRNIMIVDCIHCMPFTVVTKSFLWLRTNSSCQLQGEHASI